MAGPVCECQLRAHVESHNLEGLCKALERADIFDNHSACRQRLVGRRNMRLFLKENESVVERACLLGHLDMLEVFLLHGCSSNLPTSHGRLIHTLLTALKAHRCLVDKGTALATVRLMLEMDCDVNIKNYQGKSPLLLAAELADAPIMKEILDRCLPWQLTCAGRDNGHTPLHMACMNGSVPCVRLLLDKIPCGKISANMTIDLGDCLNLSPLLCSMMVMKHNVNFHNRHGHGAGHGGCDQKLLTVQYSHMAIVELLLHRGAEHTRHVTQRAVHQHRSPYGLIHRQNHLYYPATKSALQTALEVAHIYEVYLTVQGYRRCNQGPGHKASSPYAELVRMLVHNCNIMSFTSNELEVWANAHPHIKELLEEINKYLHDKELGLLQYPRSLLSFCRHAIRIQVAKADCLYRLDELPIPRRLKDYVMFIEI